MRRVNVGLDWISAAVGEGAINCCAAPRRRSPKSGWNGCDTAKRQIESEIDQRRAATRFEPDADLAPRSDADPSLTTDTLAADAHSPAPSHRQESLSPDEAAEETYTERLLKAKRKAREDREQGRNETDSNS